MTTVPFWLVIVTDLIIAVGCLYVGAKYSEELKGVWREWKK